MMVECTNPDTEVCTQFVVSQNSSLLDEGICIH